jgi:hypothetical protein
MRKDRVEMELLPEYSEDFLQMEKGRVASCFRQLVWEEMTTRVMHPNRIAGIADLYGLDLVEYCDLMGW